MTEQHPQQPGARRRSPRPGAASSAPAPGAPRPSWSRRTAPAAAAASPQPGTLLLYGAISGTESRPSFQWTWTFTLDPISITNQGPAIPPGQLQVRVRFQGNEVKATAPPGERAAAPCLRHLGRPDPRDQRPRSRTPELVYVNTAQVPAGAVLAFSSLSLQTPETSFPHQGTLIVTATASGRTASAPQTLEVPTDRRIDFHPGTSRLTTLNGRRAILFEGASISVIGPDPLVGGDFLRLRIRFVPDQSTSSELVDLYPARSQGAIPESTLTWTPEFGSLPNTILEWFAETTRRNGTLATIPLSDGDWVGVSHDRRGPPRAVLGRGLGRPAQRLLVGSLGVVGALDA